MRTAVVRKCNYAGASIKYTVDCSVAGATLATFYITTSAVAKRVKSAYVNQGLGAAAMIVTTMEVR